MRYKFRGKSTDDGEWVYGSYIFDPSYGARADKEGHIIAYMDSDITPYNLTYGNVDPETVGQLILEIDDKEFYEGDIFEWAGHEWELKIDTTHGIRAVYGPSNDNFNRGVAMSATIIGNIHEDEQ